MAVLRRDRRNVLEVAERVVADAEDARVGVVDVLLLLGDGVDGEPLRAGRCCRRARADSGRKECRAEDACRQHEQRSARGRAEAAGAGQAYLFVNAAIALSTSAGIGQRAFFFPSVAPFGTTAITTFFTSRAAIPLRSHDLAFSVYADVAFFWLV